MLQQYGVEVKAKGLGDGDSPGLEVKLDAAAGRVIAMRRGAGHIRHIATPTLWLQRLVINGDIQMTRVGGNDNCAHLGTKHLDYQTMIRHLKFCGIRFAEGRSRSWNTCQRLTLMSIETGGSPHSATPRHEQGLSWMLWFLDTGTWCGDTRRTLRVATWLGQQRKEV